MRRLGTKGACLIISTAKQDSSECRTIFPTSHFKDEYSQQKFHVKNNPGTIWEHSCKEKGEKKILVSVWCSWTTTLLKAPLYPLKPVLPIIPKRLL
jgi:hypothetical protein